MAVLGTLSAGKIYFGRDWGLLGVSWAVLGTSQALLGRLLATVGCLLDHSDASWMILELLGGVLGGFWNGLPRFGKDAGLQNNKDDGGLRVAVSINVKNAAKNLLGAYGTEGI